MDNTWPRWLTTVPAGDVRRHVRGAPSAASAAARGVGQAELGALHVVASLDISRLDYAAQAWYVVAEDAGYAVRRTLPKRTARRTPADTTRSRDGRCFGLPRVTQRVRWRRCPRPWPRRVPIPAPRPAMCSAGRDRDRRRTSAGRGGCRVRARTDGIHLAPSGLEAIAATARGAVLLAEGNVGLWQCCATPVGAGTNSVLPTRLPVPACDSQRPTGRSVTRPPPMRSWRGRRPFRRMVRAGRCADAQWPDPARVRSAHARRVTDSSNRDISAALFISDRTVARHLTNIYNKIGVTSRTQAARYAIDHQRTVAR